MRPPGLGALRRLPDQPGLGVLVFAHSAGLAPLGRCRLGLFVVPPLLFWTFNSLGKNLTDTVVTRREHTLVTHGPYRWVRHPFYDVGFLWLTSLSLLSANWLLALFGAAVLTMLVIRSRVEEAKLIERFGEEYRAYARRTGKFFPRFGSRV